MATIGVEIKTWVRLQNIERIGRFWTKILFILDQSTGWDLDKTEMIWWWLRDKVGVIWGFETGTSCHYWPYQSVHLWYELWLLPHEGSGDKRKIITTQHISNSFWQKIWWHQKIFYFAKIRLLKYHLEFWWQIQGLWKQNKFFYPINLIVKSKSKSLNTII